MSVTLSINKAHDAAGISFPENQSITGDGVVAHDVSVPVAWEGELTTRTDDDEGTITMDDSSHLVDTGDRVDLYWTGGSRRGCTVGTVSGASVPFSGGAGDNLPSQGEDIAVCVAVELDIGVTGDNVVAILLHSTEEGQFTFTDSGSVEKMNQPVGDTQSWDWNENNGVTNPLTGDTIAKVFVSHKDPTTAATMRVAVLYDND